MCMKTVILISICLLKNFRVFMNKSNNNSNIFPTIGSMGKSSLF